MGRASGYPTGTLLTRPVAEPEPATVTVVLADGGDLAVRLSTMDDMLVVGEAVTGQDAVRTVLRYRPDVLVFDPCLEHRAGVGVIREILAVAPGTAVLVVSALDDDAAVRAAFQAGARGYLVKGPEEVAIARVIRSVAAGELIFGASIAGRIATLLAARPCAAQAFDQLTSREREIHALLCAGMSNAAIAQRLHLAPKTIRNNLSAIFGKLGVADRAQAIAHAHR